MMVNSGEIENLGAGFLRVLKGTGNNGWVPLVQKPQGLTEKEKMRMNLQHSPEAEISGIGKGIHRPYKVKFQTGYVEGVLDCRIGVLKTVYSQYETKRYCQSMDPNLTGPERELLAYELDQVLGFDLVPPTVGREITKLGFGSVQTWVSAPTAWEWIAKGYNYKEHPENPWLHRLAAFDFITGEIDRHAANWMMDKEHRVYAIDNGYSFVKGDDRRYFRSSAGKVLVGKKMHPTVMAEVAKIQERPVVRVLGSKGFRFGEIEGVLKRIQELKKLDHWEKLGDLWA